LSPGLGDCPKSTYGKRKKRQGAIFYFPHTPFYQLTRRNIGYVYNVLFHHTLHLANHTIDESILAYKPRKWLDYYLDEQILFSGMPVWNVYLADLTGVLRNGQYRFWSC